MKLKLPESGFPGQFIAPKPFFVGVLLGFLICCVLGFICSQNQKIENFKRFHFYISPYTQYFPSLGQMVSLVKPARKDQTIVIVGGNSLFNGFGQRTEELWSEKLKQDLGDKYFVVNYSFDGAVPFEGGSWVAEMLLKQNRKVIYITTAEPRRISAPDGLLLRREFFDFKNHGLLLNSSKRSQTLDEHMNASHSNFDQSLLDLSLGKQVDLYTCSTELWQWVGHNLFFTVWCSGTHPNFLAPRASFGDTYRPHLNLDGSFLESKKNELIGEQNSVAFRNAAGDWEAFSRSWADADENYQTIPQELLRHSIVFVPRHSPLILNRFSSDQLEKYDGILEISMKRWKVLGADSAVIGKGFKPDDYLDMGHFSETGGSMVAHMVAEKIRESARRLDYE